MGEMFHVVKMTRDNLTMTKGSEDYFYFNFPKKDGYSRVVMDIKVENASSNGYGVTYFKYIGALSSWYPNTEYINKSSGVLFNFSYIAKD